MEPDRFDDVEFRVLESPEPAPRPPRRRRRRHGRWAFAMAVAAVTMGALAAGASALTDSAQAPASKKSAVSAEKSFSANDCPFKHGRNHGFDDSARY